MAPFFCGPGLRRVPYWISAVEATAASAKSELQKCGGTDMRPHTRQGRGSRVGAPPSQSLLCASTLPLLPRSQPDYHAADIWKKDVLDFQAFSQTFFELRFSLGNEGKASKNPSSQTWPGSPRRRPPRDPRPSETILPSPAKNRCSQL